MMNGIILRYFISLLLVIVTNVRGLSLLRLPHYQSSSPRIRAHTLHKYYSRTACLTSTKENEIETTKVNNGEKNSYTKESVEFNEAVNDKAKPVEDTDDNSSARFIWSEQWYPVLPLSSLEDIDNKPYPFQILGRNLVAWKSNNDGTWSVLNDECPHRKAPLSTGKVVNNNNNGCSNLMCRFHGWQFNTTGSCTSIPMFTGSDEKLQSLLQKDAFHVSSYPTKVAGGLLWMYLGGTKSTSQKSLPDLPTDALLPDDVVQNAEWLVQTFPVTWISMVENSFDPSHAPYIHEGINDFSTFGKFSPDDALPMERYELVKNTTLTVSGFEMEHTPYQQSSKNPNMTVTRQFVPPTLQKTKFPFFSVYLYFVPTGPRETTVLSIFPTPTFKWMKFIPESMKIYMFDIFHFLYITSPSNKKFNLQDTITMQGQDTRKINSMDGNIGKLVTDMTPTPSDSGVNVLQRWIRKFCNSNNPFNDPTALITSNSLIDNVKPKSLWEKHGKFCPRCKRMVKRMEKIERNSGRLYKFTLFASTILAITNSVIGQTLTIPLIGVLVALTLRQIEKLAVSGQKRMYEPIIAKDLSEVYEY